VVSDSSRGKEAKFNSLFAATSIYPSNNTSGCVVRLSGLLVPEILALQFVEMWTVCTREQDLCRFVGGSVRTPPAPSAGRATVRPPTDARDWCVHPLHAPQVGAGAVEPLTDMDVGDGENQGRMDFSHNDVDSREAIFIISVSSRCAYVPVGLLFLTRGMNSFFAAGIPTPTRQFTYQVPDWDSSPR